MPNNHGGARRGSGRKAWNHRVEADQSTLFNTLFNGSSARSTTSATTRGRGRGRSVPRRNVTTTSTTARSRSQPPSATTQNRPIARATVRGTARSTLQSQSPTQDSTSTSSARVSTQVPNRIHDATVNNNPPNNDVDDTIDESIFHRGKRISKSFNLRSQKEHLTNNSVYYKKAYRDVEENGVLWNNPPDRVVKPHPLKQCWVNFFQLRVFHWIPDAMLGKSWKPKCPCCKKNLIRWGHQHQPRLVFDQKDNYWLYAPDQYHCTTCATYNASIKDTNEKQRQTIFYSTGDVIMNQIRSENQEIHDLFPCHLTHKNAIDKQLMNLVVHCAVKGIGPGAMAENISAWHELHWQHQEKQWARYVLKWLNQPAPNQLPPINREDIEKCPFYFSNNLGGCTPSATWLIQMFCDVIKKMRKYLDSECLKRAKTTLILAIDASYKVPKWMLKWGSGRIYDALISGTNEYNEVVMQFFATSDNHEEIGLVLELLSSSGLSPKLCFSDDPARDESLLKTHFKDLPQGCVVANEDVPANLTEFQSEKRILYLHNFDNAKMGLSQFRSDIEAAINNPGETSVKISFDCEWPVSITGGPNNRRKTPGAINILQLASNILDYTVILELYNFKDNPTRIKAIGQKVKAIFSLEVSCFTGCNQKADYTGLKRDYPMFDLPQSAEKLMEDVAVMAVNRGVTTRGKNKTNLKALCEGQGIFIKKEEEIRVGSNFGTKNGLLSKDALTYCQVDAEVPLILHSIYSGLPDLTCRVTKDNMPSVGDTVDIMPSYARAVDPLAQGVVMQIGGRWSANGMCLKNTQLLIQVKKVFNHKGAIHYPSTETHQMKCSCGRKTHGKIEDNCDFYMMSQFGAPTFTMVELFSRLRHEIKDFTYPECIYKNDQLTVPQQLLNFGDETQEQENETQTHSAAVLDVIADDEPDNDDDNSDSFAVSVDDQLRDQALQLLEEDVEHPDVVCGDGEGTVEEDATIEQRRMATRDDFDEIIQNIIKEADEWAATSNQDNDGTVNNLPQRGTLADLFHLMDRPKLPMHHEYKCLFFRALRAAMFIMNPEDVAEVKEVLNSKSGTSWDKKMAFDFGYISARVRRTVPPPATLRSHS